jgi:uncharacterized protein YjbI with pentapeptide repeats
MEAKLIGSKITEARKKLNVSQAQLAQHLFISPQAVGKWERGDFSDSDISNSRIEYSYLNNCIFKDCTLNETEFSGSYINGCDFTGAGLTGAVIKSGGISGKIVKSDDPGKNHMAGVIWNHTSFIGTQIADIVFEGKIEGCSFENCTFTRVTFRNATLIHTFFKNKSLKKIRFTDCRADRLTYAFLKNGKADLTGITIQ